MSSNSSPEKRKPRRLVFDIEGDSLEPTVLWCICVIDVDTDEEWTFDNLSEFVVFCRKHPNALWVGHGIINYDIPAVNRLFGQRVIESHHVVDTLVASRLFNFSVDGGHSLSAWGNRLGFPKGDFNEWGAYDNPELERERLRRCRVYCLQDCRITKALFLKLEKAIYGPSWRNALRVEHDTAVICRELHDNGFRFDYESAKSIHTALDSLVNELSGKLRQAFPDRPRLVREVTPRATKFGTISRQGLAFVADGDLSALTPGWPFSRIEYEPFNPASPKQVVEILNAAGWNPVNKTKGYKTAEKELSALQRLPKAHRDNVRIEALTRALEQYAVYGWEVSEENLATLPEGAPEGTKLFVKWRMLSKRLQTLEEWFKAYDPRDGAIHGEFNHIGTWTHRKSHSNPNQGNVPSMDSKYHDPELRELAAKYGRAMRSCFTAGADETLVGVDADGIQLRILAHYMDDAEFTEALVNGDKDKGTDAHSLNAAALAVRGITRARAKTFIYAWLLGAGIPKIAKILGCDESASKGAVDRFIRRYRGLVRLRENIIPRDAARGYFEALDGRIIRCDEYHMLAGYLQSGESIVMKHATIAWRKELQNERIWFKQVNDVHDEWQTVCRDDGSSAQRIGRAQVQAIRDTGVALGLRCPLDGTAKFGKNWYDTH